MSAIDIHPFPRWPLIAAGSLIAVSIVGASLVRFARISETPMAVQIEKTLSQAQAFRTLTFVKMPDESLSVVDPATSTEVARLKSDEAGFIHGALRGLRRSRMIHSAPLDPTLTIARWTDGRVTVTDPASNTVIDLFAFGADNRKAFEQFLPSPQATVAAAAPAASAVPSSAGGGT